MPKIPVLYVGMQEFEDGIYLPLVDEPSGTTVVFKAEKHTVVGLSESAKARGERIPAILGGVND